MTDAFTGTLSFVPVLFENWPPPTDSLLLTLPLENGSLELWATTTSTFLAKLTPIDAETARLETCPIAGVQQSPFVFMISWDLPLIDVWVNNKHAASTDTAQSVEQAIELTVPSRESKPADLTERNEKRRTTRRRWAASLTPSHGRLPAPPEKSYEDLANRCQQLEDFVASLRRGESHMDTALASCLRTLICRHVQGSPLLQRLAGDLDLPLIVYAARPIPISPEVEEILRSAALHIDQHVAPRPGALVDTAMDLDLWLELKSAHAAGRRYTNEKVILAYANTEGAHHDLGIEPLVNEMRRLHTISRHGLQMTVLQTFLLNVAEAVIPLCRLVLASAPPMQASSD